MIDAAAAGMHVRVVIGTKRIGAVNGQLSASGGGRRSSAPAKPVEPTTARAQEPPAAPPAVDVLDLALELELAPARAEPFVPFD